MDAIGIMRHMLNTFIGAEFKHHTITHLFGGPYAGCHALAVSIFLLGILRDHMYKLALRDQPSVSFLEYGEFKMLAILLFSAGSILVVSSMYALGVTGTYLGDVSTPFSLNTCTTKWV